MRLCSIEGVEEGMVLGKSIYDFESRLLLKEGNLISSKMKSRIKDRGYNFIYIMEEGTDEVNPEGIISDEIRLQANIKLLDKADQIRKITKFQDMSHDKAVEFIENGYLKKVNIVFDMKKIVGEIINDISAIGAKHLNILMIKSNDTYFMDHAINTSVLATLIAKQYSFNAKELNSLALGTFLHDIGKIIIEQINDYDNPVKSKEYYQEHTTFGYNLLKSSPGLTPIETQIVLQHHEYQNGSGFPKGLRGDNLPPVKTTRRVPGRIFRLAEICCVVNAYDKMVLNPGSGKQMDPHDVVKQLIMDSGTKYNKDVVATLTRVVPVYPLGSCVKIENASQQSLINNSGVVAKINENNLNKPVIILTRNKYKRKITPVIVDTSELKNVNLKLIF